MPSFMRDTMVWLDFEWDKLLLMDGLTFTIYPLSPSTGKKHISSFRQLKPIIRKDDVYEECCTFCCHHHTAGRECAC